MKIMILTNSDVGLYKFRGELIAELLKQHSVTIVLPGGDCIRPMEEAGCRFIETPIDRRGINPATDVKLFARYRKILKREKPDFVITYTIKPNVYGGFACRLEGVPYAVNITGLGTAFENGGMLKKLVVFMNKAACKKAKVVFFENEGNRRLFIKEGIVPEERTHRLNGAGVNLDRYTVTDYPAGETTRFLFMGRVMKEKGIDELFDAMRKLAADGLNVHLDVLGSYEEDYRSVIEQYEKEGWLTYHGFREDVRQFIENCHCFVLPSWHEGMANTNLESAACGRPVITSNIPGCLEAVEDGVSGFLAERKNADDLYSVMKKFIALPYEARKAMGLAGRRRMEEIFDKKKVVEETIGSILE